MKALRTKLHMAEVLGAPCLAPLLCPAPLESRISYPPDLTKLVHHFPQHGRNGPCWGLMFPVGLVVAISLCVLRVDEVLERGPRRSPSCIRRLSSAILVSMVPTFASTLFIVWVVALSSCLISLTSLPRC